MNYRIIYSDELYHYGVKGMKWGVRKDERVASAESRYRGVKSDAKQARSDAQEYMKTKKALMEMPITEITTKNDVRKVYNKQYNGD